MDVDVVKAAFDRTTGTVKQRSQSPPAHLLHFTPEETCRGILESRVLRLSQARRSNDRMEIQHGLDLAAEAIREALAREPYSTERSLLEEALWLVSASAQDLDARGFGFVDAHVICFGPPETSDLNVLWSMYADEGRGFAIAFDVSRIPVVPKGPDLFKVEYDRANQLRELSQAVHLMLAALQTTTGSMHSTRKSLHPGYVGNLCGYALVQLAAAMKDDSWKDEREWRLVVSDISRSESPGLGLTRGTRVGREGGSTSYFELPFPVESILHVVVGPRVEPKVESAVRQYLDSAGYGHLQMVRSKSTWR